MRVVLDARQHAIVNSWDHRTALARQKTLAERGDVARTISVVTAQTSARIVNTAVFVLRRLRVAKSLRASFRQRLERKAGSGRFRHDPDQRNLGQRVVGIAAADIGMHAGKPDLADSLIGEVALAVGAGLERRFVALVPQCRMESRTLV